MGPVRTRARVAMSMLLAAFIFAGVSGLEVAIDADMTPQTTNLPFNTYFEDQKLQSLYLASELQAAGIVHGQQISAVSLKCAEVPDLDILNFRVAVAKLHPGPHLPRNCRIPVAARS